tara:strand:+ start:84 stop:632 length:549 start_codon:yes stop_codon:yes gene_type:complete
MNTTQPIKALAIRKETEVIFNCYNINNQIAFTLEQIKEFMLQTHNHNEFEISGSLNLDTIEVYDTFNKELLLDFHLCYSDTVAYYKINIKDPFNEFAFIEKLPTPKEPTKEDKKNLLTLILKYYLFAHEYSIYKINGKLFYDNPNGDNLISHEDLIFHMKHLMKTDTVFISDMLHDMGSDFL